MPASRQPTARSACEPQRRRHDDRFDVFLLQHLLPLGVVARRRLVLLASTSSASFRLDGLMSHSARMSANAGSTFLSSARPCPPTPMKPTRTGPPAPAPSSRPPRRARPARACRRALRESCGDPALLFRREVHAATSSSERRSGAGRGPPAIESGDPPVSKQRHGDGGQLDQGLVHEQICAFAPRLGQPAASEWRDT